MTRLGGMSGVGAVALALLAAPATGEDFDGGYIGFSGSIGSDPVITNSGRDWSASSFAGYNYRFGELLVAGGEIAAEYNPDSVWGLHVFTGKLRGRAGFVVSDRFMVYGRAGTGYMLGVDFGDGDGFIWDVGAGAEYELFDQLLLRGEVGYVSPFSELLTEQTSFRLGVLTRF